MEEAGITGLIERFADLPEPPVEERTDHDPPDIVVLALCTVMSGAEGWDDMEDWGREREARLLRDLRLRNGFSGHDTIRRVFEAISPMALEVKDNRPHLAKALRDYLSTLNTPGHGRRQVSLHETLDNRHGRIETSRCRAVGELDWLGLLGLKARWSKRACVARIESRDRRPSRNRETLRHQFAPCRQDASCTLHAARCTNPNGALRTACNGART